MEKAATIGNNRTGIDMSPIDSREMQDAVDRYSPSHREPASIAAIKADYVREAERIGSVPLPGTAKGAVKSAADKLTGNEPAVLINKLGERLAFERSGTRVYESLLIKCEVAAEGGMLAIDLPIDRLRTFHRQEAEHFKLLVDCLKQLGADPSAQTPDADVSGVAAAGMLSVITDPRTTVPQCLETMLALELTDNAGWELLIKLAEDAGKDDMAAKFRHALDQEQVHLQEIRAWYEQWVRSEAGAAVASH